MLPIKDKYNTYRFNISSRLLNIYADFGSAVVLYHQVDSIFRHTAYFLNSKKFHYYYYFIFS